MSAAAALYTPEVLALATELARYAIDDAMPHRGSARSASCGSSLELGLALDEQGRVARLGLRSHACAIGQAAAAIFAAGAIGRDRAEVAKAVAELERWLQGGDRPGWPGLEVIARARDYPARHGAIMLPWKAALHALPQA